jgi:hypothetical protein
MNKWGDELDSKAYSLLLVIGDLQGAQRVNGIVHLGFLLRLRHI